LHNSVKDYIKSKIKGVLHLPWILFLIALVFLILHHLFSIPFLRELFLIILSVTIVGMAVYYDYKWWKAKKMRAETK